MYTVSMLEAKSSLSRRIENIEMGRRSEIIITRNGRPAAKLVPINSANARGPRLGVAKGLFEVPDSIDEMNDKVAQLIRGTPQD
jgi:antitoxin (DNA-binding transcriptional repressor) of toxin-antitoxin stability system